MKRTYLFTPGLCEIGDPVPDLNCNKDLVVLLDKRCSVNLKRSVASFVVADSMPIQPDCGFVIDCTEFDEGTSESQSVWRPGEVSCVPDCQRQRRSVTLFSLLGKGWAC